MRIYVVRLCELLHSQTGVKLHPCATCFVANKFHWAGSSVMGSFAAIPLEVQT